MSRNLLLSVAVVALLASAPARSSEALAAQKNCLNCHALDRKRVGPGFRAVAARYRGDSSAAARLARKIAEGGAGAWGPVAMPAHPQLSTADAARLAAWVLSLD